MAQNRFDKGEFEQNNGYLIDVKCEAKELCTEVLEWFTVWVRPLHWAVPSSNVEE
jgi:hypothetical protein